MFRRQLAGVAIAVAAVAALATAVAAAQAAREGFVVSCHLAPGHTFVEWTNTRGVDKVHFDWSSFGTKETKFELVSPPEVSGSRRVSTPRGATSTGVRVALYARTGIPIATVEDQCLPAPRS